jgi:hypothetical protein
MGKGLPGGRRQAGLTIGSNRTALSPQIDHTAGRARQPRSRSAMLAAKALLLAAALTLPGSSCSTSLSFGRPHVVDKLKHAMPTDFL